MIKMSYNMHMFLYMCLVYTVILRTRTTSAQKIYNIENICNMAGSYDIDSDIKVHFRGGYNQGAGISVTSCQVVLRATNGDHILSFADFNIELTCGVALSIKYAGTQKSYDCNTLSPGKFSSLTRDAVIILTKPVNSASTFGKFQFTVTAGIKPVDPALSTSSVSVTLIVGAVVGVCLFLLLMCIIGVCMHKKIRRAKMNEMYYANQARQSELDTSQNKSVGFTNQDYNSNGEASPLAKTKLLKGFSENINESPNSGRKLNRPETLNIRNGYKKPHAEDRERRANDVNYTENPDEVYYNMDDERIEQPNRPRTPVTPILSALQSNAKFRKSYSENERDADERAKRISYSTSNDSINNERPPLPKVPESSKRPVNLKKNQSMRKATRPDSYIDYSSSTQGSEEMEDDRGHNREVVQKPKHSLKPNRKKSPEQDRRQGNKARDPRLNDLRDDEDERVGLFVKQGSTRSSARSSKRSQKSPRLGKGSKGFGHRRSNSRGDDAISIGSRTDLESLPPLQRSSSKTSLYASRSSLYSRRRGRDRADSCGESIVSYAHDDIDYYRRSRRSERDYDEYEDDFGGYEKPISRNDRLRMSRSDHDLGRAMKETSTQTLRETATQTGHDQPVTVHTKRVVKKRPRSRSLSAMGTQTQKRERTKSRTKSKENVAATSDEETEVKEVKPPKPKPKPKPKPRKSLTENTAQSDNEGLKKKKRQRSKSDANLRSAKSTENLKNDSNAVPGPQVPQLMATSHTVPSNIQNYAPNGVLPVPPPYTTLPHGAQHLQYAPNQQPVMVQAQPFPQAAQPIVRPLMQPPKPPVPAKPRTKSNWDMLMEITDKQKSGVPSDTESIVSSVFTSNPPPTYQPGQAGIYPYQQGYSQYAMQTGQQYHQPVQQAQPPVQQTHHQMQSVQQVHPQIQPVQQVPMVQQPYQQQVQPNHQEAQPPSGRYPSTQGWTQQSGTSDSTSGSGMSGSGSSTSGMYVTQPQDLSSQGKSSWDRLKELTDQQPQVAPSVKRDRTNESVV